MRICFIATNHGVSWGASEYLWSGAARELAAMGDVEVVACVGGRTAEVPAVRALGDAGCDVLVRSVDEDERSFGRGLVPPTAAREVLTRRPDLVVVSHGDNREGFPWMEASAAEGLPFVSVAHRASEWDWPHSSIVGRLRDAYLAARATHFVSEHNRRLTERMICARLPRATVVRNPFDADYDEPIPWPHDEPFRMACIARLDLCSKAHDVLFEVLAQPKWRQRPFEIDVVGREGPHAELLHELRSLLELDRVRMCSSVDDIRSVWARCHALVLPSRMEGLPVAVVEALLAGRPCLVTDAGGSAEVVEHGRTGWVAESPTPAALDRALEEAWSMRATWAEMGALGARRIRTLVPPNPARTYAELLRSLVPVGDPVR